MIGTVHPPIHYTCSLKVAICTGFCHFYFSRVHSQYISKIWVLSRANIFLYLKKLWYAVLDQYHSPEMSNGTRLYRIFSDHDLEAIDLIECFKASGLTIREIRHFMSLVKQGDVTLGERLAIFQAHIARLEEKLAAVQNALEHSRSTLAFYEIAAKTGSEEAAKEIYLARYGEADE